MRPFFLILVSLLVLRVGYGQEYGLASIYSDAYHGKPTAYGEVYDKNKLTCAHKRYPLGTMLRVTRMDNNQSVVVRVNDKGPFLPGRIVEVSRAAAQKIGLSGEGITQVKVDLIQEEPEPETERSVAVTPPPPVPKPEPTPQSEPKPQPIQKQSPPEPEPEKQATAQAPASEPATPKPTNVNTKPSAGEDMQDFFGLYKIIPQTDITTGYGVQIASMKDYLSALRRVSQLDKNYFDNMLISVERGANGPLYKVLLGPFQNESQAKNYANNLKTKYNIQGFVVNIADMSYNQPAEGTKP